MASSSGSTSSDGEDFEKVYIPGISRASTNALGTTRRVPTYLSSRESSITDEEYEKISNRDLQSVNGSPEPEGVVVVKLEVPDEAEAVGNVEAVEKTSEIQRLQDCIKKLEDRVYDLVTDNVEVNKKLEEKQQKIEKLELEKIEGEKSLNQLLQEMEISKNQKTIYIGKDQLEKLEAENRKLRDELEVMKDPEVNQFYRELNMSQTEEKIKNLEEQLKKKNLKIAELELTVNLGETSYDTYKVRAIPTYGGNLGFLGLPVKGADKKPKTSISKDEEHDIEVLQQKVTTRNMEIKRLRKIIEDQKSEKAQNSSESKDPTSTSRLPEYTSRKRSTTDDLGYYNNPPMYWNNPAPAPPNNKIYIYNPATTEALERLRQTEEQLIQARDDLEQTNQQIAVLVEHNDYLRSVEANENSQEQKKLRDEIENLNATINYLKKTW